MFLPVIEPMKLSRIGASFDNPGGDKMRGSTFWLATGVLLFLAWAISYFVFHVNGVLIHLLLVFALISFTIYVFTGKGGVE